MAMAHKRQADPPAKDDARLLTHGEVAKLLGVSPGTLYNWRMVRKGPTFIKMGHLIRYTLHDVLEWQQSLTKVESADL
jgi:excisionase family DNA binding protein